MPHTALITGANRGLGLETARRLAASGHRVLLSARSGSDAKAAARSLTGDVTPWTLDVTDPDSIRALGVALEKAGETVDILINNAGTYPQDDVLDGDPAELSTCLAVSVEGPVALCRLLVPGMIARGYGRIVNVSSGYGSWAEGLAGPFSYTVSKAAMNVFTVQLARTLPAGVKANAVSPGWVRTRMGGADANRSVEEGADSIVWLATLDADGPNGGYFRDRKPARW